MNCVYKFHIAALCPEGGRDEYVVTVTTEDGMIEVEKLIEAAATVVAAGPAYQEHICSKIATALDGIKGGPSGNVHMEGVHQGVLTACVEEFGT